MTPVHQQVVERLLEAVRLLQNCPGFARLVPEVRTNIAFSLPEPVSPEDVAAVDGRITVVAGRPRAAGPVCFGASDHLARRIIELRRYDPSVRACLNFRWNESIHGFLKEWCREQGLELGLVDRTDEPKELIGQDRGSMPWKVKRLVESCGGRVPPVFYENRGWGKEPLFVLVGPEPGPLAERACAIARGFAATAGR